MQAKTTSATPNGKSTTTVLCVTYEGDAIPDEPRAIDYLMHVAFINKATRQERIFTITGDGKIEGDLSAQEAARVVWAALVTANQDRPDAG